MKHQIFSSSVLLFHVYPAKVWLAAAALAIVSVFGSSSSMAQTNLLSARVLVEDRREATLIRAASEALEQVLVRVSGNKSVGALPGIAQALATARDRLSLYTYAEDGSGLALIAEFDGIIIKDLLRAAGSTYWGASRSPVLVWLVVDEVGGRRFANSMADADLLSSLQAAFEERGVVMRLPLLDLEDSLALGPNIVWQRVVPRIRAASQRYGVDHILVGRYVELTDGRLLIDWLYLDDDQMLTAQVEGANLGTVATVGVDLAADTMAERYAINLNEASRQGRLTVAIDGVHSFEDYRQVVGVFQALELLDGVRVAGIDGQRLRLSVSGLATGEELKRLIGPRTGLDTIAVSDDSDLNLSWRAPKP